MTAVSASYQLRKDSPLPPIGSASGNATDVYSRTGTGARPAYCGSRTTTAHSDPPDAVPDTASFSSKLTNIEAQRVMSVLMDMQRKVQLVGLLPDSMDRRMSTIFSAEIFAAIAELRHLEDRYETLLGENINKPSRDSITPEMRDIGRQIRSVTRSLVRHFIQNPTAASKLRYLKSTKLPSVAQFEQLLQEVKMLVYERLGTTVEDEKAKLDQLSIIIAKEQKTSNDVASLREELDKAKKERTVEINKRNEVIRRLKEELRNIKKQAEETTKRLEARSKQKEDSDVQQFRDKELSLKEETAALRTELHELLKANGEKEAQLRKRKFKIESEVENWIHKYDQDMDEKQTELEDITAIYMEEKAQLDELSARHADLKKEYEAIMAERKIEEEKRMEREKQLKRQATAAVRIQAWFKGWRVRRDLKKQRSGSGKKGAKGKGGKGKAKTPKKK
ncbi:hypothetical protein DFJ77DRAFT_472408 [Powellomyces hirtus]|nr:hypothetical protein DFJ77DRAFT_472408 [Powellomyces hirtus]